MSTIQPPTGGSPDSERFVATNGGGCGPDGREVVNRRTGSIAAAAKGDRGGK